MIAGAVVTGVIRWQSGESDLPLGPDTSETLAAHLDLRAKAASSPEEQQMIALLREGCEAAERLAAAHPSDPSSCHAMAVAQYELNRMEAAQQWWQRATEIDPQFVEGYRWLAYIAMDRGNFAEAVTLYQQALVIDPTHADARFGLSEALVAQGDFTGALQWLEKAKLPLEPASGPAFLLLGQIHLELQQYGQAQECFAKAARLMPRAPQPYYGLSNASALLGESEKSAEYLRKFQELRQAQKASRSTTQGIAGDREDVRRKVARILVVVGEAAARVGDFTEAEKHWQHAAQVDPRDRSSRELLVDFYERRQQLQAVVSLLEQLVSAAPEYTRYRLMLASAYARLGRVEPAETVLREAHRLNPDDPTVSIVLAQFLASQNRNLDEAVQLAQRAVEQAPTASNYYVLSVALAGTGQRQSALAAIEEALRREPGERRWQEHYERLRKAN
ncbi:MAG: tetratricopeptide repeat protein [Pirellulaceae bacterium]